MDYENPNEQWGTYINESQNNYQNIVDTIPKEYKPLSTWAYVGYNLLFSIPLIGLIFLIVFSFNNDNINRRNYARSFFCTMLIGLLLLALIIAPIVIIIAKVIMAIGENLVALV